MEAAVEAVPAKKPRGRPSKFTHVLAETICKRLSLGETLRSVCRSDDMPSHSTVLSWLAKKSFLDQYAQAREAGYRLMADEIVDISDDGTNDYVERERADGSKHVVFDGEHVQRSRLRVDTRKWLLSKALPKIYGDRLVTEHTGKDGGPIKTESTQTLDLSNLSPEAREEVRTALEAAKPK